jgi:hypothetical protein
MGKQSSKKKVQRAARARGGARSARSANSLLWPSVIVAVVILGAVLIVASRGANQRAGEGERPRLFATNPEDHWHEAYGVNVCGSYQADLPEAVNSGIHTHGDGLIHVEAQNSAETGANANVGKFVDDYGNGFRIGDGELRLPGGKAYKNGDKCGDKPGRVAAYVWDSSDDKTPQIVTTGIGKLRLRDQRLIALSFNPADGAPDQPPSKRNLADPNAGEGGGPASTQPEPSATTPAAPVTTSP